MNIKISYLKSMLHENEDFILSNKSFISKIENNINCSLVDSPVDDYDCDLKLIFISSGGSEGLFLNVIDKLKEPYILLTSGENNSLAASLEILTYLNLHHLKGEIIHGSISYIGKRIIELASKNTVNLLSKKRYGLIGNPSDWLISSIPDRVILENKFGISLIDIPINEVEKSFYGLYNLNIYEKLNFNSKELQASSNIYNSLNKIVNNYNLDGFTIRCFDLLKTVKSTACLGLATLNDSGIIGTCEGDVMALVSMAIVKELTGQSSFQANPSSINIENNKITLAHCTIPFNMCTFYTISSHFESGIGAAVKGNLKLDTVTIFRLSSNLKDYYVGKGKIVANLSNPLLCRTQIEVEMDSDISSLLNNPCGNHHIIFYGDYVELINNFMNNL